MEEVECYGSCEVEINDDEAGFQIHAHRIGNITNYLSSLIRYTKHI